MLIETAAASQKQYCILFIFIPLKASDHTNAKFVTKLSIKKGLFKYILRSTQDQDHMSVSSVHLHSPRKATCVHTSRYVFDCTILDALEEDVS